MGMRVSILEIRHQSLLYSSEQKLKINFFTIFLQNLFLPGCVTRSNFHDKNLMRVINAFLKGKNSLNMVCYSFETLPIIKYAYSDHLSDMRVFFITAVFYAGFFISAVFYAGFLYGVMWVYFLIPSIIVKICMQDGRIFF